mmetsp:Transcript_9247/g.25864  ORF Transcript_9247/g.25864 Transcript_9247/m.25864 type:complete len:83 (+) Transcript_9247:740-988(+)
MLAAIAAPGRGASPGPVTARKVAADLAHVLPVGGHHLQRQLVQEHQDCQFGFNVRHLVLRAGASVMAQRDQQMACRVFCAMG